MPTVVELLDALRLSPGVEVWVEVSGGVAFVRTDGEPLPLLGLEVRPQSFDAAALVGAVADEAERRPHPCPVEGPHGPHRYEIARGGLAAGGLVAYGRCPGAPPAGPA